MIRKSVFSSMVAGASLLLVPAFASAQGLNNQWVTFSKQNSHLPSAGTTITDSDTQVFFKTADLDKDGWDDVVAVRKQQASQAGKKRAFLLMNVNGVLTDKTAQYAQASTVVGDLGFNTPCNNREVAIGDVNNDGWLDLVTAASISDGDPKYISHPRVYMNLGKDGNGNWLGFRYEENRIPQLFAVSSGNPAAPRFCGMALGDVNGDGYADLYFVDYDTTETNIVENPANDLNDRLLINGGASNPGFFTDESATRMTVSQLQSQFGADAQMYDVNKDGLLDLIKDTTLANPRKVAIYYNNPSNVGNFTAMGEQIVSTTSAPYGMNVGDLNKDNFSDIVIVDDGADKFRLGTGVGGGPLFYATWGAAKNYTFIAGAGSDDGFGHTPHIVDLDGNGWNDVLITDVDGDLTGCGRRLHIYHNTGSVPGDMNLVLREEAELATGNQGAGWKGVNGMLAADLKGSYDVAFGDYDHDGDTDMVVGICAGTNYWRNETNPTYCQADLGFAGPGSMALSICGGAPLNLGYSATLKVTGAPPGGLVYLAAGVVNNPTPLLGGTLVPVPILILLPIPADGSGNITVPGINGGGGPVTVYIQAVVADPSVGGAGYAFSNAVALNLLANP